MEPNDRPPVAAAERAGSPGAGSRRAGSPHAEPPGARPAGGDPEFGPSGYLSERAARRARKIVLRAPMGLQWPVAAALAAVVVLALGLLYLTSRTGPPGAPFVETGALSQVDPRGAAVLEVGGTEVLVVRGGGGLSAFAAPDGDVGWCAASRRVEAPDGRVWTADGRLVGGEGTSLVPRRAAVHDGRLFLDPTSGPSRPPETPRGEKPQCR